METHVNAMASKIGLSSSKLKPALAYLEDKNRKLIITSKVKPIAIYGLQMMLGQTQAITLKAKTIAM